MKGDKEISVFVDESGSYDLNANSSRFYIVWKDFFMGIGNFRKNYLKPILRKEA